MADFVDDLNLESGKASNPSSFVDDLDLTEKPKPSLWDRAKSAVGIGEQPPIQAVEPKPALRTMTVDPTAGPLTRAATIVNHGATRSWEPESEPSFVGDVIIPTAKDTFGVITKMGAGGVKGATLGAVNPEEGTVGIPFTNIKRRVSMPLEDALQALGVQTEQPYFRTDIAAGGAEMASIAAPWSGASRLLSTGVNALKTAKAGKALTVAGEEATKASKFLGAGERVATQAAAGGIVGAAEVRNPGESIIENTLTTAAIGAGMQVLGEGVAVIANATGLTKHGAYTKLKKDLSDIFFKNSKEPMTKPEADKLADQVISAKLREEGVSFEDVTASQLRKAGKDIRQFKERKIAEEGTERKPEETVEAEYAEEPGVKPFEDDLNLGGNKNATVAGEKSKGDLTEYKGTDQSRTPAEPVSSDRAPESREVKTPEETQIVEPKRLVDDILKDLDEVQGQQAEIKQAKDAGIKVSPEKETVVEQKADDLKTELTEAVKEEKAKTDGIELKSEIQEALQKPTPVPVSVATATKAQTKETLKSKLQDGEIEDDSPVRLTTVDELRSIIKKNGLSVGTDFEGRPSISAQKLKKEAPVVAYGANDKISAAIIFKKDHAIGKGEQINEVLMNPDISVKDLRFVIDGHDKILAFDELKALYSKPEPKPKKSLFNNPPPGGWTEADKVPKDQKPIGYSEEANNFVREQSKIFTEEAKKKGVSPDKQTAYAVKQINKLVGSKFRSAIDIMAVKRYLDIQKKQVEKPAEPATIPNVTTPKGTANIPAKDKPQAEAGFTKVFRGEYQGNKKGNYYSPDVEFARQFTQSGLDKEIIEGFIKNKDIYRPKEDVYAGDPDAIEGIVQEAKNNGFKAVELSEGDGQPKSIYVIDRSAVKSTKQYTEHPNPSRPPKGTASDIPAKTTPQAEAWKDTSKWDVPALKTREYDADNDFFQTGPPTKESIAEDLEYQRWKHNDDLVRNYEPPIKGKFLTPENIDEISSVLLAAKEGKINATHAGKIVYKNLPLPDETLQGSGMLGDIFAGSIKDNINYYLAEYLRGKNIQRYDLDGKPEFWPKHDWNKFIKDEYGQRGFKNEQQAKEFFDKYRTGKPLTIADNPPVPGSQYFKENSRLWDEIINGFRDNPTKIIRDVFEDIKGRIEEDNATLQVFNMYYGMDGEFNPDAIARRNAEEIQKRRDSFKLIKTELPNPARPPEVGGQSVNLSTEEVKSKQTEIPGASYSETFSLTNPETEISKPLPEQVTPKNQDLFADQIPDATKKVEATKPKEPWQMTREAIKSQNSKAMDYSKTPIEDSVKVGDEFDWEFQGERRNARIIKINDYDDGKTFKVVLSGINKALPGTQAEKGKTISGYTINDLLKLGFHKNIIKQALSEGKPVPENVLADYPELRGNKKSSVEKSKRLPKETNGDILIEKKEGELDVNSDGILRGPEGEPVLAEPPGVPPDTKAGGGMGDVSVGKTGKTPGQSGKKGRSPARKPRTPGDTEGRDNGDSSGNSSSTASEQRTELTDSDVDRGPREEDKAGDEKSPPKKQLAPEDQNHRIAADDVIVPPGKISRAKANVRAINLLRELEAENRNPSPDEKNILARFTGWGGLGEIAFRDEFTDYIDRYSGRYTPKEWWQREPKTADEFKKWKSEYGELLYEPLGGSMTEEEWADARRSTLNAFYTSREVIQNGLWPLAERLGFKNGSMLEPSAGIGHILGLIPEKLSKTIRLMGIELDSMTGRILSKLYPQARIQITGFQDAKGLPDNSVDLVMSNFPFGDYSVNDNRHPDYSGWSIHNYFFARSIDAAKPGGLVIGITSHFTMDAVSGTKMREYLNARADFVGAIRLPKTAFEKNAGTEVVTDIIVLRKKSIQPFAEAQAFKNVVEISIGEGKAIVNEYFQNHPEMVLGEHSLEGSMYGENEYTVIPKGDLSAELEAVVKRFPENIMSDKSPEVKAAETLYAAQGDKSNTLVVRDGKPYFIDDNGTLVVPEWVKKNEKQVKAYVDLKNAFQQQIHFELDENSAETAIGAQRELLNDLYDQYVKKYGRLNERKNAFLSEDDEFFGTLALEDVKKVIVEKPVLSGKNKGQIRQGYENKYSKADIFSKRTVFPFIEPTEAASVEDALNISITYRHGIDIDFVSNLLRVTPEEAGQQIVDGGFGFKNPKTGLIESKSKYLSGFVKEKLIDAELAAADDPAFEKNVTALKEVQPPYLGIDKIYVRLGSTWVPPKVIERFLSKVMDVSADVTYSMAAGEGRWSIKIRGGQYNALNIDTWGSEGILGHDMVNDCLNLKRTLVYDRDADNKPFVNKEKSAKAQQQQAKIQEEFKAFVKREESITSEIEKIYNEVANISVERKYDIPKLKHYPGASHAIELREHQKRGVARSLEDSTFFAHGVGTGKTFLYLTIAMEKKRIGAANKSLIVVQGSTLSSYAAATKQLYPTAKVLIPNDKQRDAKNRNRLMTRIATNDWDIIVVPHEFYDMLPVNPDYEAGFVREQLEEIMALMRDEARKNGKKSRRVKDLEKIKEKKKARLAELAASKKDNAIYFDQLGIDCLLVDEAHRYKRNEFFTKMQNVKGIDHGVAKRSFNMMMKCRFIQDKTGGKNIFFATGTPISNTTAELWTMVRYVRPDLLKRFHVEDFDSFATTFGDVRLDLELTPTGDYKDVERFNRYVNGPELLQMWKTAADVMLSDDLNIPGIPKLKGGAAQDMTVERTDDIADYIKYLRGWRLWWEHLDGLEKKRNSHVPLSIFLRAKQAAIDMRLINPDLPDNPGSKLNRATDEVFQRWEATKDQKAAQVVFCDMVESSDGRFNLYKELKRKLIEKGIPEDEIAIRREYKESQLETLFSKVNSGDIRVIIGGTEQLGVGVNMQERLYALHNIDAPPRPMDMEQRRGRIQRQGNIFQEVEQLNYGVKNTLDATIYQRLQQKQRFQNQVLRGDIQDRSFDDPSDDVQLSFEEMMAAFSGNPLLRERYGLENDIRKLQIANDAHADKHSKSRQEIRYLKGDSRYGSIKGAKDALAAATKLGAQIEEMFPDGKISSISFGKTEFKEDFSKHISERLDEFQAKSYEYYKSLEPINNAYNITDHPALHIKINDLDVKIKPEPSWEIFELGNNAKTYRPTDMAFSYDLKFSGVVIQGSSIRSGQGFLTSVKSKLEYIKGERIKEHEGVLKQREKDLQTHEEILQKPFDGATKLRESVDRLAEVKKALENAHDLDSSTEDDAIRFFLENRGKYHIPTAKETEKSEAVIKSDSDKYFIHTSDDGFKEVKGTPVDIMPGFTFFAWKAGVNNWVVTERSTGLRVMAGDTKAAAIGNARQLTKDKAANIVEAVQRAINDGKMSPWYSAISKSEETTPDHSTPPDTTLYSGLDPTQIVSTLKGLRGNIQEATPYLEALGHKVYSSGKKNFHEWRHRMRVILGDLWESFRRLIQKIWNKLKEERGSWSNVETLTENQREARKRIERNLSIMGEEAQKAGVSIEDYMKATGMSEGQVTRLMEYAKAQPVEAPEGYREVLPDEVLPAGSDVKMDFVSGKSFVKIKDTTGVKHAVVEEERGKAGKEPVKKQEPRGNEGMFQAAKAAVDSGEINPRLLAQEVAKKPRPITTEEEFALMYDRMRLKNELRDIQGRIDTAQKGNDAQAEADLIERRAVLEADLDTNDQATTHGGSEVGRSLQARTRMINEDYSLEEILLRARQDNGGTLSEEMRKKYEALAREIEEANEKIKAYEEKIASLEAKRSFQRMKNDDVIIRHLGQAKEKRASAKKALDDEFSQLTKQLNAALGGIHMNFDPTAVKILALMAKNRIKAGILTPDGIVNEIYEQVHESYPEVEKRDIRDAISGYGRTLQLSKDEIDVQLREAKRLMRLISSYEDASSGQVPLRSGMQRDKMTNEVRELGRRVRQAMREAGIDWESSLSPEEQWKTSLDAVKTRLRNQIHDIKQQIETGEKSPKKIGIKYDEEAEALRAQRDKLKDILISIEGKPGMSPEQKINLAMAAVEKSIAEYERRISEKDLAPKKQGTGSPETPELKSLRDRRDELRAIYKEMQKEAKPKKSPEEIALKSYKTRMKNRIKELEEKLEKKDFAEKPKRELRLDDEGLTLKHNLDRAISRLNEARLKDQLARRNWLQKFIGGTAETANFMRSLKASMDVSAVFRQGLFTVVSHPVVGAKALPAMFKAFKNDKYRFAVEQDILNRPNYKLYKDSGLELTDIGTDLSKMEETFMSRLAEKIPGVAGSQRAYTTFLNKIRVDTFDLLIKNLVKSEGKHTPEEAKAIATLINESTGRGKVGMKPNTLSGLNTIFFAPRLVASRFQILAGHSMWKGTKASRKLIAKEYGRFLAGMSVVYLLAQLAGFDIEWDPRSSDFGKIKIGNTRIDPLGGFSQVIVFLSRVIGGKTKTGSGVIAPNRGENIPYGVDNTYQLIARFVRSKLAPAVGVPIDIRLGEDIVGNKITAFNPDELKAPETLADIPQQIGKVSSIPEKAFAPMALVDTYEVMRDRGIPEGLALGMLGMLGVGLQTYEKNTKQKLKDDLRDAIKSGDQEAIDAAKEAISDASENELITERDKKRILKDAKDDAFVSAAKKMPLPALAEMIKEDATDDQKEALHDIFKKKIDRARQERRIDSETQDRYYEILEEMR